MYKAQQNSKCKLCSDRDETTKHINECSQLAQRKYKNRHEWVGKVINWESCKKLKFDHTTKYGCTTWTLTKTAGEEATRQLHKNAASNIEQVLAETPHKAPTIRPPASHHENSPGSTKQTYRSLLEKQGRAHK